MHRLLLRLSQRSVSGITHISGRLEINSVAIPSASELVNLCRGVSTATGRLARITSTALVQQNCCCLLSLVCLAAAGALPIQGDTPIQQAIQACCSSLGRQPGTAEATLVSIHVLPNVYQYTRSSMTDHASQPSLLVLQADRLTDNWYVTAADVAALTQVSPQPITTTHII